MSSFYAFLYRMKYINRWGLMKNSATENIAEHSQHTALLAHALALIERNVFAREIDPNEVGMIALFHETGEVLTGDLPTPIKYFSSEIERAYKSVESSAENSLLATLPDELRGDIAALVAPKKERYECRLVKCADKLSAYIKCIEETKSLNGEFKSALNSIEKTLNEQRNSFPSLDYFMKNILPAYFKTLDEL